MALDALNEPQWLEWAAHNLALGEAEGKVRDELVGNGFSGGEAGSAIAGILTSPIYAAARRIAIDLEKWTALGDTLVELESQAFSFRRIARVSNLSLQDFLRNYYSLNRPVIIEDVAVTWPALSKWNLDHFRTVYGNEEVTYQRDRPADDFRHSFIDHTVTARLSDYIDLLTQGIETNDYYLISRDRLLERERFRQLLDDIRFDPRYFDADAAEGRVSLWLGPAGTTTPLHRDFLNMYFAQILGRKRVKLIPSKQLHKVYNEAGYHSAVDLDRDPLEDYPKLKEAYILEEVIGPGEILFIPVGWWHHVRALDVSITITGSNFRFDNALSRTF